MFKKVGNLTILIASLLGVVVFILLYYFDLVTITDNSTILGYVVGPVDYAGKIVIMGVENSEGAYTTTPSSAAFAAWTLIAAGTAICILSSAIRCFGLKVKILCFLGGVCLLAGSICLFFVPQTFLTSNYTDLTNVTSAATTGLSWLTSLGIGGSVLALYCGLLG